MLARLSMALGTGPPALLMSKVVVPPPASSSDRCPDPECAVSASVPSGSWIITLRQCACRSQTWTPERRRLETLWETQQKLILILYFLFLNLFFSLNQGIFERLKVLFNALLDLLLQQSWPLPGLIMWLRGGPTGCTISHTSISPSCRSTALSNRRMAATSRLVTTAGLQKERGILFQRRAGERHWTCSAFQYN